ncbi:MAG: hypothetical protein LW700_06665 [Gemmataceae bacterium]|nr:hypothetical protein [Gemmataceae bacterium]
MAWRLARSFCLLAAGASLCLPAGCTATRLRHRTANFGTTLPDLQYQQVLDNLARFAENPGAMPAHVNLREGTTQVTDSLSGGAAVDLGPPTDWLPQLFGQRTVVAQWGMQPVIDPLELKLLRVAYRRAAGLPEMPDDDILQDLGHELKAQVANNPDLHDETELFFEYHSRQNATYPRFEESVVTTNSESVVAGADVPRRDRSPLARDVARQVKVIEKELLEIEPGWYCVGRWCDVPRHARFVGRHNSTWVWVDPARQDDLTRFTLTVMKLGTLLKDTQTLISPGQVKFSPGDRGG